MQPCNYEAMPSATTSGNTWSERRARTSGGAGGAAGGRGAAGRTVVQWCSMRLACSNRCSGSSPPPPARRSNSSLARACAARACAACAADRACSATEVSVNSAFCVWPAASRAEPAPLANGEVPSSADPHSPSPLPCALPPAGWQPAPKCGPAPLPSSFSAQWKHSRACFAKPAALRRLSSAKASAALAWAASPAASACSASSC
jgi:hypothetical protein